MSRSLPLVFLALALAPIIPIAAQQPIRLGEPSTRSADSFSRITGLRELPDGRVLVSDSRERKVQIVDLTGGALEPVGREGAGPTEYASPGALFALPGGRSLMADTRNQRYLLFGPDGKPTGTTPFFRIINGNVTLSFGAPSGVDTEGRLYFEQRVFGGRGLPDSVPLVRWTIGSARADTVGFLRRGAATTLTPRPTGSGGVGFTASATLVWQPLEAWGVTGEGAIARLFPLPYRIGWYGPDLRLRLGAPEPYTPIRVTEVDRQAYREQQATVPPAIITTRRSDGTTESSSPPRPEPEFAETKPPFWGAGSVLVSPEGEVWVQRTRPAGDPVPTYDVFDRRGTVIRRVLLPANSRVAGFGRESLYVAQADADDLETLLRYPMPR